MPARLRAALLFFSVAGALPAQANYYESGFDHLPGSAAGVSLAGGDGFSVPVTVPASGDGAIHAYVGNTLGMPVMPGAGNFLGLDAALAPARVERITNLPVDCHVHVEFDFCIRYSGAGAPTGVIGGFSLQPEGSARSASLLARWPAGSGSPPATWNADAVVGPGPGVAVPVPDARFQGLAVGTWYRWGCTLHLATGEYMLFVMDDLAGNRTHFEPPAGTMMANAAGALPTAFRLSALGAGCRVAFDRVSISYHATFTPFGIGCAGTAGVPQLYGQRPALGWPLQMLLVNLPLDVGAIAIGFSNTQWNGVPLPADMSAAGLTGCSAFIAPAQVDLVFGASGYAYWNTFVPDDATLMGLEFFAQGASFDPAANPAGLVLSHAAHAWIGR